MEGQQRAITLLLSLFTLCCYALAANVVHMPMSRSGPDLKVMRRGLNGNVLGRSTLPSDLFNNMTGGAGYLVEVNVGSPGQAVSLIVDTGSSDTFVLAKTDDQCNDPAIIYVYGGCIGGTFDPASSSTFATIAAGGFKIKYLDNSQSSGDYISDNFEIGGSFVSGLQMGLALHSTVGVGIMGIGYSTAESVTFKNRYPNLVDQLVAQKFINLRAYSLYLNDKETSSGSILFGGIDTEKFIGTLSVLPLQKDPRTNTVSDFIILMTSLSITDKSGTSSWTSSTISLPVVLDSGTTLTYLPTDLANTIISQLGAVDDTAYSDLIFVDCDWRTRRPYDSISFGFGGSNGPVIRVPLSELIRTIHGHYPDSPFKNTCDLGLRAAQLSIYLLGDTFLRSAYVVYDLDHNQIGLAQTNFEAAGSQIHEIPTGGSGIPVLSGQSSGLTQVPQGHFTTIQISSSLITPTHLGTITKSEAKTVFTSSATSSATSDATSGSTSSLTSSFTSRSPPSAGTGDNTIPKSTGISTSASTQTTVFTQSVASTVSPTTSKSAAARNVAVVCEKWPVVFSIGFLMAFVTGTWSLLM